MINGINSVSFVTKPMFKAQMPNIETENAPIQKEVSFKGAEALAAYNAPIINKLNKLDVEPIELINTNINEINGEKIYTSDGKLYSIVAQDENTTTEYFPKEDDENTIDSVVVTDKNSGKVIKQQFNNIDNHTTVCSYSETGEAEKMTRYENGQPVYINKTTFKPNGIKTDISYDVKEEHYHVREFGDNIKNYKFATFDKNKNLINVSASKQFKAKTLRTDIDFYNGAMISVRNNEEINLPNTLGRECLNNPDLTPTPKFELKDEIINADGEKTYYSNGALETKTTADGYKAFFAPNRDLSKIETGNSSIEFNYGSQTIKEKLDENKTKITSYYKDGDFSVEITDDNNSKSAFFNKKGIIESYTEQTFENGEEKEYKSFDFDKNGMLTGSNSFKN